MEQFDKRDVAAEMLDAAVCEHLDHRRHFAAYNLASVAEELFSKLLRLEGKSDASKLQIGAVKAMSRAVGQPEGNDRAWRRTFFALKNAIKHMDSGADRYIKANIETSARQKIGDAIHNLEQLGIRRSSSVRRFDQYRLSKRTASVL